MHRGPEDGVGAAYSGVASHLQGVNGTDLSTALVQILALLRPWLCALGAPLGTVLSMLGGLTHPILIPPKEVGSFGDPIL